MILCIQIKILINGYCNDGDALVHAHFVVDMYAIKLLCYDASVYALCTSFSNFVFNSKPDKTENSIFAFFHSLNQFLLNNFSAHGTKMISN